MKTKSIFSIVVVFAFVFLLVPALFAEVDVTSKASIMSHGFAFDEPIFKGKFPLVNLYHNVVVGIDIANLMEVSENSPPNLLEEIMRKSFWKVRSEFLSDIRSSERMR